MKRIFRGVLPMLFACVLAQGAAFAQTRDIERSGGPYVPTPQIVVDQMLRFANVKESDYVMDLGSGDGVLVRTAALQMKAAGLGVEIDPELVKMANALARKQGVAERASFQVLDVFKADLSKASVVTLYLLPSMMMNLRTKIFNELRPGARVVSHDYHFGDWVADDRITFDVPEKELINGVPSATVYLWTIPAKVGGRWQIKVDGLAQPQAMELTQNFHQTRGNLLDAKGANITDVAVKGESISFSIWHGGARHHYRGRVNGNAMSGVVNVNGRDTKWQALRDGGRG
ncbi:MAG: methyltransferase domain-containing protein [Betaproteobacteria bacterium]|nr:methyltransferase domain-containing protein [Betaproteobacteria bacterium]